MKHLIYVIAFGISLILCRIYEKKIDKSVKKNRVLWFILIILPVVLLASFRYGIGIDYFSYQKQIRELKGFSSYYIKEPINYIMLIIARLCFSSVNLYFFLYSLLTTVITFKAIEYFKEKISITFALFIYYMTYFLVSFNIVRQLLAVAIIFYGTRYIYEKNFKKYLICVIIATMVHKISIAMIFLYLLSNHFEIKKISEKAKNILYYIAMLLLPIIAIPVMILISKITGMFTTYLGNDTNIKLTFLLYWIPVFILIMYKRKELLKENKENEFLIRAYFLQIPFNIFGWFISFTNRFALYAGASQIILLPLIQGITKGKEKKIVTFLITSWYIFYFIVMFVILKSNGAYPYKSIFFK